MQAGKVIGREDMKIWKRWNSNDDRKECRE